MSYQEKELCKPYLSYSWEGYMQNMPPVTHGEELCKEKCRKSFKIYSLYTFFMGRMYASQKQYLYLIISL